MHPRPRNPTFLGSLYLNFKAMNQQSNSPNNPDEKSDAEVLRALASNVNALWKMMTSHAARVSAIQAVVCRAVARLEERDVSDVQRELDQIEAATLETVLLDVGDMHPKVAELLDPRFIGTPHPTSDSP